MNLSTDEFRSLNAIIAQLAFDYEPWRAHHRELAQYILPMRYSWLADAATVIPGAVSISSTKRSDSNRNKQILDATGTKAARDLAAGMLDGVTSPVRPWFNLRPNGFTSDEVLPVELAAWLEEIRRRMLLVLSESNFYNSMATLLIDMVVFGTGGMLIYEDFEDVIRCYNIPVGEFRLAQDSRRVISTLGRIQQFTVEQLIGEFGEENCTKFVREKWSKSGKERYHSISVSHLIEPNTNDSRHIPGGFAFREFYWENTNNPDRLVLRRAGFTERPFGFPRWETIGNETYGLSPGMDALPDIIQLQHETLRKAEALDKMTDPPVVMDAIMRQQRGAANPGSRFYAPSHSQAGARALYDVRMPLAELSADIVDVQTRIRDAFFNDLFRMISQLETVRSATEIDARREEKLVLMGAVLGRLETEALDPFIIRIFGIMQRVGLLPEAPAGFGPIDVQVQYVSILSDAQRAVGTGVIERFMQIIGNVSSLRPEVGELPNWTEMLRIYATRLNVPAKSLHSKEEMQAIADQQRQAQQAQQAAQLGQDLTGAAKNLAGIDVGGGQSAFQQLSGL